MNDITALVKTTNMKKGRSSAAVITGTVRYKKDGSVAKKIGRPPKKATPTIHNFNNNSNYSSNNKDLLLHRYDNTCRGNPNYGYRANGDNNTIVAPISMNVSTVSDPLDHCSEWTTLAWKRPSKSAIDNHNSPKYTKM